MSESDWKLASALWAKLLDIFDTILSWIDFLDYSSFSSINNLSDAESILDFMQTAQWLFTNLDQEYFSWCEGILEWPRPNHMWIVMHYASLDLMQLVVAYLKKNNVTEWASLSVNNILN